MRRFFKFSIHEQIHKMKSTKEYEGSNFPIKKPYRSEEQAKAWSPFVDCGEVEEEEEEEKEEDRSTRQPKWFNLDWLEGSKSCRVEEGRLKLEDTTRRKIFNRLLL
jgi:hypothetical protein